MYANIMWFQTSFIPDKEQYQSTKAQLLAQMDVAMGGRVAEEIIFGADKVSTGMCVIVQCNDQHFSF